VARCYQGFSDDRKSPGGIFARIKDTVGVCKAVKSFALDTGVKIAIENHAGDMQAWEVLQLIEQAGKEFVGANMDSGNAVWTMEDPLASLETLGRHVVTTSLRDSAIWESANGATVQWTAMGEGMIDWKKYFARFAELCPGVPVHIETISGFNHEIPYLKPDFWSAWPKAKAVDFARFVALARTGKPRETYKAPADKDRKLAEQEYQKGEIERSTRTVSAIRASIPPGVLRSSRLPRITRSTGEPRALATRIPSAKCSSGVPHLSLNDFEVAQMLHVPRWICSPLSAARALISARCLS